MNTNAHDMIYKHCLVQCVKIRNSSAVHLNRLGLWPIVDSDSRMKNSSVIIPT